MIASGVVGLATDATEAADVARAPEATAEQIDYFETHIRPLLSKHCVQCHGPEEQESNLRLDTPAGIAKGGAAGPSVVAGKPGASLLLTAVKQRGELSMPPEGKLNAQEIGKLETWIANGAALPGAAVGQVRSAEIDWEAARNHWSFRPLHGTPPAVRDVSWLKTAVDTFVLKELEDRDLRPSPAADPATLLRRVTITLTGLPPTPEQASEFAADPSPRNYARIVDQLLASTAYGERWGRHWLDVARYADSNGLDENIAHGNAWRYRDFVVEAFNNDLPFDRFIHMQLAGDLLLAEQPEADVHARRQHLVATGYLSLGPKVLAEVDEQKMEMDIIDEQLTTIGKSLVGLTLGCARCHDHKFDPLTARDYYGLAGIFKSTRTMEHFTKIARWNEASLPMDELETRKSDGLKSELEQAQSELKRWEELAKAKPAAGESQGDAAAKVKDVKAEIKRLTDALENVASAMSVGERDEIVNVSVHIRGSHLTLGEEVPRRFPEVLAPELTPLPEKTSGRLAFARWLTGPQQHLLARVFVNRVWRWHWGKGLTPSMDNFGALGEAPSHPELLDYLALELIRNDWSVKHLHRLILLSNAYQQSSAHREDAMAVDPDNRWLWRFDTRRLEAESLRDSMLAVSGQLDRTMGGSLLHVGNREFFFNHTSKDETKYDVTRRSLYLPVVRNNLYDAFMLFDYSDASTMQGNRVNSVTAPQALFLLNSELVDRAAEGLAARTSHLVGQERAARLMELAYSRPATDQESQRASEFAAAYARETDTTRAWRALAHALLASNEFLYIR
ncbi:MAG: PSD1 domain-containing protein [Planctomycetales bacterium]|nr:PSD1 domain-containing protein [Planctomycetales bacterium]